jgi:hypothetical protein
VIDLLEVPVTELAAAEDWAGLEHRFGVLPLVDAFFGPIAELASGRIRGALGLFTPAPAPGWGAAALEGEATAGGLHLRGEVRVPCPVFDRAVVLARLEDGVHRLAWLDPGTRGVERQGRWLRVAGAFVGPDLVSRPVSLAPDDELSRLLADYAGAWARTAALCARAGARALRQAARTTVRGGTAFSASQLVALGITEVEIEADLTLAAVQQGFDNLLVATAAARTLSAVAAKTRELRDSFGLEVHGPLAGDGAETLTVFLGGPLVLESEVARALGIGGHLEAGA